MLSAVRLYRAKASIGCFGLSEAPQDPRRSDRAMTTRGIVREAVRVRLACFTLVLLVFGAIVTAPTQRSSGSESQRPTHGILRTFALPTPCSAGLAVKAWTKSEDAVELVRSEDDEDDDEEACSATRQAYDTYDSTLSSTRSTPVRDLVIAGTVSALRLRC